jgi:hypothetical protein
MTNYWVFREFLKHKPKITLPVVFTNYHCNYQ